MLLNLENLINIKTNQKLSNYKTGQFLGKGRYSNVYVCYDIETNTKYVLKLIDKIIYRDKIITTNLEREIQILDKLYNNSHICKLYSIFDTANKICLIFEYGGINLYEYIKINILTRQELLTIYKQCLECINSIHKAGYVHLDIKPENFVINDNIVKLIDFEFSHPIGSIISGIYGTLDYLSPDMILKKSNICKINNDIWSLGVLLSDIMSNMTNKIYNDGDLGEITILIQKSVFNLNNVPDDIKSIVLYILVDNTPNINDILEKINNLIYNE
jgi:serine/threonine protein kinase